MLEALPSESSSAYRIRVRLVETHGCQYQPGHVAYFFDKLVKPSPDEQTAVYFLDSLYTALMAPEKKVALRAYVQACEYSAAGVARKLRYGWETEFFEARRRIESFLD